MLPFVVTIGLDALELLVAFLQAYVFAMLTCMYLNDALHPRSLTLRSTQDEFRHAKQEHPMEPHELAIAAKYVGAGLAAIGTGAAGIGVGTLFGQFLNGALRNPSAVEGQFGRLIFGFAVTEALGIFALLISFLLLFAV